MSNITKIDVKDLNLDLENYRTIHQPNEIEAIKAMVAIGSDRFYSLMESLIEDGYYPTENIIVIKKKEEYIVKEGNRRIGALKIIFGYIEYEDIPEDKRSRIDSITAEWKMLNQKVPCIVYDSNEAEIVLKNIALIHAKGEKAGRDKWPAVARARFNRDEKKVKEFGLDLLEKYLANSHNISINQQEIWSGDYPLTILNEALSKLYSLLEFSSVEDIIKSYPKKNRRVLESIMYDIGTHKLGFKDLRNENMAWGKKYGIQIEEPQTAASEDESAAATEMGTTNRTNDTPQENSGSIINQEPYAEPLNDPKSVYSELSKLKPRGQGRGKIVMLLNEMKVIKIEKCPFSFCFLLRSILEISIKVYAKEHLIDHCPQVENNGKDKSLADNIRNIVNFLTSNRKDIEKTKLLHGVITELDKKEGLLTVNSLNQLIHNPNFAYQTSDICILFGNIFPLINLLNS